MSALAIPDARQFLPELAGACNLAVMIYHLSEFGAPKALKALERAQNKTDIQD